MKALPAVLLAMLSAGAAVADEQPYMDDRSDAAALVRSFYNAINRQEYARAWDYFGESKPAKDFNSFSTGFEQTSEVEVQTGEAGTEGAAGSTYFNLPVAIRASNKDGSEALFAGCYTVRLSNPQIQEPPFTGLLIEKGALKPAEGTLAEALPESCGDGPAPAPVPKDAVLEQARAAFAIHRNRCDAFAPGREAPEEPEDYTISFHGRHDAETDPERTVRLFRFYCTSGAYNEVHRYYMADNDGVRELQFATPELDIHYEGGDSEGKVEAINVIGYNSVGELLNSSYDEATHTITTHGKWRGVGDASSNGTWLFRDGEFSLVQYDVDASYDGEINPQTVLDYNTAP